MAEALQFLEQRPHLMHLSSSILIFSHEKRAKKLSIVPTGQIVLQYVRPPFQARMMITTSVTAAITNVGIDFIQMSVSEKA